MPATEPQKNQFLSRLAKDTDRKNWNFEKLQLLLRLSPAKFDEAIADFIDCFGDEERDGYYDHRSRPVVSIVAPPPLRIDRSATFNPAKFIDDGNRWYIMEQQDPESLAVTELDFSISNFTLKENFRVGFKASELKRVQRECSVSTKGVKPLEDSRVILADAKVAQALHEEEGQVILRFLYDTLGITRVAFQGTLLKDNGPGRHMICLVRDEDSGNHGYWQKTCYSPTHAFESGIPTLCLDRKSLSQGCDDS